MPNSGVLAKNLTSYSFEYNPEQGCLKKSIFNVVSTIKSYKDVHKECYRFCS